MGKYFTQVAELPSVGRRLNGGFSFESVNGQLQPGEYLIGCYFNGAFQTAPWITDSSLFSHFEETSISSEYYAVKEEDFLVYVK